ncbi:MAG: hypothetical protein ACJAQR_001003 [Bacteroidia bacterium]|jgi:hypothetical protein
MSRIIPYNANSASVCAGDKCVTVYGEAADVMKTIAITATAIIAVVAIAKALS